MQRVVAPWSPRANLIARRGGPGAEALPGPGSRPGGIRAARSALGWAACNWRGWAHPPLVLLGSVRTVRAAPLTPDHARGSYTVWHAGSSLQA